MQYQLCRHIKTNGTQCQSPTLTRQPLCFFHDRLYRRHSGFRHTPATRGYLIPGQHIELTPLEDRESVQVALSCVINALATGQLETKRATALLYGLQLASMNAANLRNSGLPSQTVHSVESTPEGIDLARPGATGELPRILEDPYEEEEEQNEEEEG